MTDVKACLEAIAARPNVDATRIGVVGYCMGGRNAFRAAIEFPDRIRAAAAIHPGGVVTDEPTSPHLAAHRVKARLYFARAKDDMFFTTEQATVLGESLSAAAARHEIVPYEARHGFAIPDPPFYDAGEAERHWHAVLALFRSEM